MAHLHTRFPSQQQLNPVTQPCFPSRSHNSGNHNTEIHRIGIYYIGFHRTGSQRFGIHRIGSQNVGTCSVWLRDQKRRRAGMTVAGIVGEAVKGAVREAWSAPGVAPVQRAVILLTLLALIVRTVWGSLALVRYGVYAYWVHATLEPWSQTLSEEKIARQGKSKGQENVVVARNVRYGPAERNLLDVYVPCKPDVSGEELLPVVIFVHGGVWASGDKWQFSPLGSFLAGEGGVIAVLVQYTLYPEGLAIDQVGEVSEALAWTMDNIAQYGGDPSRVFLMGHSSGAHLCAMVLWERACRRMEEPLRPLPPHLDARLPRGFLGLAGVYNIGEHFQYEVGRGVGAVSCMRPANGWEPQFDAMSPSLLFESLLLREGAQLLPDGDDDGDASTTPADGRGADASTSAAPSVPRFRGLELVPRCLLVASHHDVTVPPTSSMAFNAVLQKLGCDARVVLHDELAHDDFALWHHGWGSLKTHIGPFVEELLRFVTEDA